MKATITIADTTKEIPTVLGDAGEGIFKDGEGSILILLDDIEAALIIEKGCIYVEELPSDTPVVPFKGMLEITLKG